MKLFGDEPATVANGDSSASTTDIGKQAPQPKNEKKKKVSFARVHIREYEVLVLVARRRPAWIRTRHDDNESAERSLTWKFQEQPSIDVTRYEALRQPTRRRGMDLVRSTERKKQRWWKSSRCRGERPPPRRLDTFASATASFSSTGSSSVLSMALCTY